MASDQTIPARLVAEGVGLPRVWANTEGELVSTVDFLGGYTPRPMDLDLSDPQTAFGCALKLDEWERAGLVVGAGGWAEAVACGHLPTVCKMLAARLTQIGMDHAALAGITDPVAALAAIYDEVSDE
jgi:hypothetical protein